MFYSNDCGSIMSPYLVTGSCTVPKRRCYVDIKNCFVTFVFKWIAQSLQTVKNGVYYAN